MATKASRDIPAFILIDPRRHNAHKNLGLALAGQEQFLEAARCLLEADRRLPADGRARQHLAALLATHPEVLRDDEGLATECRDRGLLGLTDRAGSA